MSLDINTNMMAINAALNLGNHYNALATSTERLSSGLRINSAADDPAGEAVSEQMGVSIAGMNQGVRNAGDGLSMAQTADGALSVINQNLTTMKELAEQAATGTYTTAQRLILDSEYQAMAAEINRIANATNFNGVSLLNGSLSTMNGGSGMKIHFGTGNNSSEDYYYINIGDMRATTTTGLQIGGGATADTWVGSGAGTVVSANAGLSGGYFVFGYNQGGTTDTSAGAVANIAGFYQAASGVTTLSDLVNEINQGTAARGVFNLGTAAVAANSGASIDINGTKYAIWVTTDATAAQFVGYNIITLVSNASLASDDTAFMSAINALNGSVWAVQGSDGDSSNIYLFAKQAGVAGNADIISVAATLSYAGYYSGAVTASNLVGLANSSFTLSGGGQTWAVAAEATVNSANGTFQGYTLQLTGNGRGTGYGITIDPAAGAIAGQTIQPTFGVSTNFTETAGTGNGNWNGADILTQSDAQLALGAIDMAVQREAVIQAALGSMENRLNGTIQNLQVQGENLKAAQSRITDVDVATEMTNFTTQSILTQAATAMLAQANALPRLALQLLGGNGGV